MNVNDDIDPDLPPLSAEEEARLRAALAALGPAAGEADAAGGPGEAGARPAFRAALRARFVDGSITAPVEAPGGPAARGPVAAPRPRVIRPWMAALAAAALLAVVVFAWLPRPESSRGAAWTVVAATTDSTADDAPVLRVDGRDVALASLAAGGATLSPGARVELPAGVALELRLDGVLGFETTAGAAFTVPTEGAIRVATVERGEVRYVTGPAFAGTRLAVESPEARVEVTGTTFVVITEPGMTCVCVGEGTVHVVARGDENGDTVRTRLAAHDVAAGNRREIYADGTMSEELPVHAHEAMKMDMLRERMDAVMAGATTRP